MGSFSRRNGYVDSALKCECSSDMLNNRIIATISNFEQPTSMSFMDHSPTIIQSLLSEFGIIGSSGTSSIDHKTNVALLQKYVNDSNKWFTIYDIIESYLTLVSSNTSKYVTKEFNRILEEEGFSYKISRRKIIPLTNPHEIQSIEKSTQTPFSAVNMHIEKAVKLFSSRPQPDYENSIKESISAVESICCIITNSSSKDATLGKTLKKLKDHGIYIHPAMENAYSSLYGYTSNEDGIRHGGMDFKSAPYEDAKYMLISCSAFVNYLIEKWTKIQSSN